MTLLEFRRASEDDVLAIIALLDDDVFGAARESVADDGYLAAFREIDADPRAVFDRYESMGDSPLG